VIETEIELRRLDLCQADLDSDAPSDLCVSLVDELPVHAAFSGSIPGVCRFAINPGSVGLVPQPGAGPGAIEAAFLGPIIAVWLRSRGFLCLHGSSVTIGVDTLVFLGTSGAGKSTMARALVESGCRLLADDLTAYDPERGLVMPAYPELRLWPNALSQFSAAAFPDHDLGPSSEKRALQVKTAYDPVPRRPTHLFILETAAAVQLRPCRSSEALVDLLHHTWEFHLLAHEREQVVGHFEQVMQLMSGVAIWRLARTDRFEDLTEGAELALSVLER
jgi:hypothetical protein